MSASTLAQLALMGLVIAALPLSLLWLARGANKFARLCQVTLFMTFDLIIFGGFTRLTDSGLGCPDWPGCYGQANPLQAQADIHSAQMAMPTGPVTITKAWIEMLHRYLATSVGVLIIAMVIFAWFFWLKSGRRARAFNPRLPMVLFGAVCVQGAFGAFTVTMKLQPVIVTGHLLLALTLLALLAWQSARQDTRYTVSNAAAALRTPALIAGVVLALQLALGGWVSTNYAALACTDFPLCHGVWVPPMDFANGFTLWRKLGMTANGAYLPFDALTAIHVTHRSFAFVVALVLGSVAWRARQIDGMQRLAKALGAALCLQLATGLATVYLEWPLALAVLHNAGAALLVTLVTMLNYKTRSAPAVPAQSATRTPVGVFQPIE